MGLKTAGFRDANVMIGAWWRREPWDRWYGRRLGHAMTQQTPFEREQIRPPAEAEREQIRPPAEAESVEAESVRTESVERPIPPRVGWLQRRRTKVIAEIERNRRGEYRVPTWALAAILIAIIVAWAALIIFG
jgi:hypothetical protein